MHNGDNPLRFLPWTRATTSDMLSPVSSSRRKKSTSSAVQVSWKRKARRAQSGSQFDLNVNGSCNVPPPHSIRFVCLSVVEITVVGLFFTRTLWGLQATDCPSQSRHNEKLPPRLFSRAFSEDKSTETAFYRPSVLLHPVWPPYSGGYNYPGFEIHATCLSAGCCHSTVLVFCSFYTDTVA